MPSGNFWCASLLLLAFFFIKGDRYLNAVRACRSTSLVLQLITSRFKELSGRFTLKTELALENPEFKKLFCGLKAKELHQETVTPGTFTETAVGQRDPGERPLQNEREPLPVRAGPGEQFAAATGSKPRGAAQARGRTLRPLVFSVFSGFKT